MVVSTKWRSPPAELPLKPPPPHSSELTNQGIDEVHTLSRGIVGKEDIPSRVTDTAANELASNRAEGAKIQAPCLAHCGHTTSRHGVLPTYTDEGCVDCVCGAWDPPPEAHAIKGKRKKPLGKPCIISLAPPLSPPVVVPLMEPQESTPLVVLGFFGQHVTCPIAPYNGTDWVQCDLRKVWVHTSCNNLKSVPKQYVCPGCLHHGFSTRDIPRGEDTYLKNMDTQRQPIKGLLEGSYGKGAAGDFRVYMAELGDSTPTLGRTIGERFFGTFYASCIILLLLNRIIAFLQDKVRNGDSSPWWSSLLRWAQAPSTCLFLMMGTVTHACWAKPFFQEFHAGGTVSVAAAHPYVLQFQEALRSWALDPKLALQFEGKGMAIVQTHPLLPILLRRLRIVFRVMSER